MSAARTSPSPKTWTPNSRRLPRELGWLDVPLMCSYEIHVPGSLQRCIRIMINWNTDKTQKEIVHPYLKDAKQLRPDLSTLPPVNYEELERWIEDYITTHEP